LPVSKMDTADWLAAAIAFSLPWSTSATGVLVVLWLIALLFTLRPKDVGHQALSLVGGIPLLLLALGAVGMFWADASAAEKFGGLTGFVKLITIPLLMAQFARSHGGRRVMAAFLVSCVLLLLASYAVKIWPALPKKEDGVPVKSYIVQSAEFTVCAAVLLHFAYERARQSSWLVAGALAILAVAFCLNLFFVVTARTSLAIIPVLIFAYGTWRFGSRGAIASIASIAILGATLWSTSPYVRQRVSGIWYESRAYQVRNVITSSGDRIVFWEKSLRFIASAPVFGHGTGSISPLFREAAKGETGAEAHLSSNPHNQTFAVGIQLGMLGILVLWAMWLSQALLFRGLGDLEWIGLVLLIQNVVGSLFNSFIFDFTEGWIYVVGIGVTAGMVTRSRASRLGRPN
jgi:O-antigen ligase